MCRSLHHACVVLSVQECRLWLRLLHCYLLPLITFRGEDLPAVSLAQSEHIQLLHRMDQQVEQVSIQTLKVSEYLDTCGIEC